MLDEIEKENFIGLEFVELNACPGGCVGGALAVENAYIAKARLQSLRRYLPVSLNHPTDIGSDGRLPDEVLWETGVDYSPVLRLDENRVTALKKMAQIQQISETLCDLDCGSLRRAHLPRISRGRGQRRGLGGRLHHQAEAEATAAGERRK